MIVCQCPFGMGKVYFEYSVFLIISYLFLPGSSDKAQYCLKFIRMAVVSGQHIKSLSLSTTSLETMGGYSDICYLHISIIYLIKG